MMNVIPLSLFFFFFFLSVARAQSPVRTLTLTNGTTYAAVIQNLTSIHNDNSTRFGKIKSDRVDIYRDNYCYKLRRGSNSVSDKRVGICMRLRLRLSANASAYMFVTGQGIFYHDLESGSYTRVPGKWRGERWYEDYVEEQLELRRRVHVCKDGLPDEIRLNGAVKRMASWDTLKQCRRVCLAKGTLEKVSHVRLSGWTWAVVYCLGDVCATPYHVVRVQKEKGKCKEYVTMDALCNRKSYDSECTQSVQQVAKALLVTQRVGPLDVTFVAAETPFVRSFLLLLQHVVDYLHFYVPSVLLLFTRRKRSLRRKVL